MIHNQLVTQHLSDCHTTLKRISTSSLCKTPRRRPTAIPSECALMLLIDNLVSGSRPLTVSNTMLSDGSQIHCVDLLRISGEKVGLLYALFPSSF
ncbi:hypothetical protein CDAR_386071 [Caerostris darwini]|uniref:Uncharacterized protein n=1 Tax=Caerostris darwini TaxID=1538125 RepID=A0AAV4SMM3_9ARAC|nr:hypothetical protein CDAR_386071 [Caerostris darwini]